MRVLGDGVPGLEVLEAEVVLGDRHVVDRNHFAGLLREEVVGRAGGVAGELAFAGQLGGGKVTRHLTPRHEFSQYAAYGALAQGNAVIASQDDGQIGLAVGGVLAAQAKHEVAHGLRDGALA